MVYFTILIFTGHLYLVYDESGIEVGTTILLYCLIKYIVYIA